VTDEQLHVFHTVTVDLLGRYEEQQDTESVELSVIGQVPAPDHALI